MACGRWDYLKGENLPRTHTTKRILYSSEEFAALISDATGWNLLRVETTDNGVAVTLSRLDSDAADAQA